VSECVIIEEAKKQAKAAYKYFPVAFMLTELQNSGLILFHGGRQC